jgi:hypothetical protein
MNENNWYVYKHIRLDKNEPFYIGIGNKKNFGRAFEFSKDKRNEIWWKIYSKTNISVEILYESLTKTDASLKEQELIKKYGRKDLNEGSLCNMTDGGDGIWNCIRTEKTRKLLSEQKIGSKNPQFGKKQSKELIEKRFRNIRGIKKSDEDKKKQSLSTIKSGQAKEVDVFKYNTNEYIGRFYAISEACRILGFHHLNGKAVQVAKGKRKQTQGYVFTYVN